MGDSIVVGIAATTAEGTKGGDTDGKTGFVEIVLCALADSVTGSVERSES